MITEMNVQQCQVLIFLRWQDDYEWLGVEGVICERYLCVQTWVNMISDITEKPGYAWTQNINLLRENGE